MCCYYHHGYCSIWVVCVTSLWIIIKKIHGILHAPKLYNIINYFSFRSLADADKILLIYLFHVKSYIWNMGTLMTIEFSSTRWHLITCPSPPDFSEKNNQNNLELLQPHCFPLWWNQLSPIYEPTPQAWLKTLA